MKKKFDSVEFQRKRRKELSNKIAKLSDPKILCLFNAKALVTKPLKKAA